MPETYTTISTTPELRDYIRERKRGGETYSDVIARVFEEAGYPPAESN